MYFKIIGVVCILLSASAIGFLAGIDLQKHLEDLLYLKQIMMMLKSEIRYGRATLEEAFLNIGKRIKEPYKTWLLILSEKLTERKENAFEVVWTESIEQELTASKLKKEEKETLIDFGKQLGYSDKELQLGIIDLFVERLENEIQKNREGLAVKKRLCNCLGVMGGIFLAVILI